MADDGTKESLKDSVREYLTEPVRARSVLPPFVDIFDDNSTCTNWPYTPWFTGCIQHLLFMHLWDFKSNRSFLKSRRWTRTSHFLSNSHIIHGIWTHDGSNLIGQLRMWHTQFSEAHSYVQQGKHTNNLFISFILLDSDERVGRTFRVWPDISHRAPTGTPVHVHWPTALPRYGLWKW